MDIATLVVDQTGQQIDEIVDATAIPTWRRNSIGKCDLTPPAGGAFAALLEPGAELQVWIDGACRWWGIPDVGRHEGGQPTLTLDCFEAWGRLDERRLRTTVRYDDVDQATIIADLVARAQVDGNLALLVDAPATGTLRDREYLRDERPSFWQLIEALTGVDGGPDVWQTVTADGLLRTVTVRTVRGARHDEWSLEYGAESIANIAEYSWSWERPTGNDVETTAGDGGAKLFGRATDAGAIAEWGAIQDVIAAAEGTNKVATLTAASAGEVARRAHPTVLLSSVTVTGPTDLLTAGAPGDVVPISVDDGGIQVVADYIINEFTLDGYAGRAKLEVEPA